MRDAFEEKPDLAIDVAHGSHRPEKEAQLRFVAIRERIERVATEILGARHPRTATAITSSRSATCTLSWPRARFRADRSSSCVRDTNAGVKVVPELGLFLARLNFGLTFGRFALDGDHTRSGSTRR